MDEKRLRIWYDPETDFLELQWSDAGGTFEPTADDRILERIDKEGHRTGVMVQGVTTLAGEPFEIMLDGTGTRRMVGVHQAAGELGVSPRRVHALLQRGRVEGARQVVGHWLIPSPVSLIPGTRGPIGVAGERSKS